VIERPVTLPPAQRRRWWDDASLGERAWSILDAATLRLRTDPRVLGYPVAMDIAAEIHAYGIAWSDARRAAIVECAERAARGDTFAPVCHRCFGDHEGRGRGVLPAQITDVATQFCQRCGAAADCLVARVDPECDHSRIDPRLQRCESCGAEAQWIETTAGETLTARRGG
jgi:hypothetical protein